MDSKFINLNHTLYYVFYATLENRNYIAVQSKAHYTIINKFNKTVDRYPIQHNFKIDLIRALKKTYDK